MGVLLVAVVLKILFLQAKGDPDGPSGARQPVTPPPPPLEVGSAEPEDTATLPPWVQPEAPPDHHPGVPDGAVSSEWVVKLKTTTRDSYLGLGGLYDYNRTLDQSELSNIADSIAEDLPLEHAGHVTPFHGVFRLRYDPRKESGHGRLRVRDAEGIKQRFEELDRSLDAHRLVVWAARQNPLIRHKRSVAVDFNDPMFGKQWHLVSPWWIANWE